jgi:hypothetical protein
METIKKITVFFIVTATLLYPSAETIAQENGPIAALLILENETPPPVEYSKKAKFSKSKKGGRAMSSSKKAQKRKFRKKKRGIMNAVIVGSILLALIGVGLIALLIVLVTKAARIKKAFKPAKGMSREAYYEKIGMDTRAEFPNASRSKINEIRARKEDIAKLEVRIYMKPENEGYNKTLRIDKRALAEYIKTHK